MLSVIVLSIIMLSVIMLIVIMLSVIILSPASRQGVLEKLCAAITLEPEGLQQFCSQFWAAG
jgi:hypothetical protein